jgi:hypothetical protein
LVKIVDADGQLLNADAKSTYHIKELDTVVVQGTARRDENENLTVLATGIFVRH